VEPTAEQMDQPMVICFGKLPTISDLTSVRPRKLRLAAEETAAATTTTTTTAAAAAAAAAAAEGAPGVTEGGDDKEGEGDGGEEQQRPPAEARSVMAGLLTSAHKVLSESLARDHKQLKKLAKHFLQDEATTGALTEKQASRLEEARKAQVSQRDFEKMIFFIPKV